MNFLLICFQYSTYLRVLCFCNCVFVLPLQLYADITLSIVLLQNSLAIIPCSEHNPILHLVVILQFWRLKKWNHPFIAITPRTTLTWSGCICLGLWGIRRFVIYLWLLVVYVYWDDYKFRIWHLCSYHINLFFFSLWKAARELGKEGRKEERKEGRKGAWIPFNSKLYFGVHDYSLAENAFSNQQKQSRLIDKALKYITRC